MTIAGRAGLAALVALAAFALPLTAGAHQKSTSYSTWSLDESGARVHVRVSQLDLSRVALAFRGTGGPDDPVARYLERHLVLTAGGETCAPDPASPRQAPEGWVVYSWRVRCGDGPRAIVSALLLDVAPGHLHFARATPPRGGLERLLSEAEPRWELGEAGAVPEAPPDRSGTALGGYVALGVEHILTGWDHLAFVLALLLLAGSLGELATLVTGFTVAHSLTLALATLGVVRPDAEPVEALIGFSIALVAVENAWILGGRDRLLPALVPLALLGLAALPGVRVPGLALAGLALFTACHFAALRRAARPAPLRAAVAFAFGLVHGFGFAGVLAELELPTQRLAAALFGFNVGVELGQLAVVALLWPLLWGLTRARPLQARLVAELGSAAVCALGIYWFVTRSLG